MTGSREGAQVVHEAIRDRLLSPEFPCLGARSALRRGTYEFGVYDELGTSDAARRLWGDLRAFTPRTHGDDAVFTTYIASFRQPADIGEREFEALLWQQLQLLHDIDRRCHAWDPRVSSDPHDGRFSFSVAGAAYFVVGLHPRSSRQARRFALPTLCFNPHAQFDVLRLTGRYARLRDRIRDRDQVLQGSINPMLRDFGDVSEAAQYSGRRTAPSWRCPLQTHRAG
jgi:uncharacterized protein